MRLMVNLLTAAAAISLATPALAAPTITSAAVSGPSGAVWDTVTNSFFTLFISRPIASILNPNDDFAGAPLINAVSGTFDFALNGDGWPLDTPRPADGAPRTAPNSDALYTLTLQLAEGAMTGTLSGVYNPNTFVFVPGSAPIAFATGNYALSDFNWTRGLSNIVGAFSATDTSYDRAARPGSGLDYSGSFALSASVPEPATWGLMILGFGVAGAGLRARRSAKVALA